jgi:hypothetical protein
MNLALFMIRSYESLTPVEETGFHLYGAWHLYWHL